MTASHDKSLVLIGPAEFKTGMIASAMMQGVLARQSFAKNPYFVVFNDPSQVSQYLSLLRIGCGIVVRNCAPDDPEFIRLLEIDDAKGGNIGGTVFPAMVFRIYCGDAEEWSETPIASTLKYRFIAEPLLSQQALQKMSSFAEQASPQMHKISKEFQMQLAEVCEDRLVARCAFGLDRVFKRGRYFQDDLVPVKDDKPIMEQTSILTDGVAAVRCLNQAALKDATSIGGAALKVLMQAAAEEGVDFHALAHKVCRKWGRGAFHIRFTSWDAVAACHAEDTRDTFRRLYIAADGKRSFQVLTDDEQKSVISSFSISAGCIGNKVVFSPAKYLAAKFRGKDQETQMLRQYNPSSMVLVCGELALAIEGRIHEDSISLSGINFLRQPNMPKSPKSPHCVREHPEAVSTSQAPRSIEDTSIDIACTIEKEIEHANMLAKKQKEESRASDRTILAAANEGLLEAPRVANEGLLEAHLEAASAKPVSNRSRKRKEKARVRIKHMRDAQQRKVDEEFEEFLRFTSFAREKEAKYPLVETPGLQAKPPCIRKAKKTSTNALAQDLQLGLWAAKLR